jgi:hypothetical protein
LLIKRDSLKHSLKLQNEELQRLTKEKYKYDSITQEVRKQFQEKKGYIDLLYAKIDSITEINSMFDIKDKNKNVYQTLLNNNFLENDKKIRKILKRLYSEFKIDSKDTIVISDSVNFFTFSKLQYRILNSSPFVEEVKQYQLPIKYFEEIQNLLNNHEIKVISDEALFLKKITGIDNIFLNNQKDIDLLHIEINSLDIDSIQNILAKRESYIDWGKLGIEVSIPSIEDELRKIENQIETEKKQIEDKRILEEKKYDNYKKFKTKIVNGVEIYTIPLSEINFQNGEPLKIARTQTEWDKLCESHIPAYKFKDFDEKNIQFGLIYNYYAYIDDREIAPIGFHKFNTQDLNYLINQKVFDLKMTKECPYCNNGKVEVLEWCSKCSFWTKDQRKYNVCKSCNNNYVKVNGWKTCEACHGTKILKYNALEDREISVFPGSVSMPYGLRKNYKIMIDESGKFAQRLDENYISARNINEHEFQIIICKDRKNFTKNPENIEYIQIGNLHVMSESLVRTQFNNGDIIQNIEDPIEWELAIKNNIPAYCYFNNDKTSQDILYNIHVLNDQRGIIPPGWRQITEFDKVNIAYNLGYDFSNESAIINHNKNKGCRNRKGYFISYEYDNGIKVIGNWDYDDWRDRDNEILSVQSLVCVRDANDTICEILNQEDAIDYNENIRYSKLLKSEFNQEDFDHFPAWGSAENMYGSIYSLIYNEQGVNSINYLVKNNFEEIFSKTSKLKFLGLDDGPYECENNMLENDYQHSTAAIILEKCEIPNAIKCTYKIDAINDYDSYLLTEKLVVVYLYRCGEFSFCSNDGIELDILFTPWTNCKPYSDPIRNLSIFFSNGTRYWAHNDLNWTDKIEFSNIKIHEELKLKKAIEMTYKFLMDY